MEGYAWLLTWWLLLALQMTYGKWMTEKIEMTQWERVFYTNAFAIPPTIALYYGTGESAKVARGRGGSGGVRVHVARRQLRHGRGHQLQRLARADR